MQIPENEFILKMTGRNETPIEKLGGFHKPDDELHEQIRERVHKKMQREITTSILWTLVKTKEPIGISRKGYKQTACPHISIYISVTSSKNIIRQEGKE